MTTAEVLEIYWHFTNRHSPGSAEAAAILTLAIVLSKVLAPPAPPRQAPAGKKRKAVKHAE